MEDVMKPYRSFHGLLHSLSVVAVVVLLVACGGSNGVPASNNPAQPTSTSQPAALTQEPQSSSGPTGSSASIPQACALLTAADVEKITGYGGVADSQDIGGEQGTLCTIVAGQGKFKVQINSSQFPIPIPPTAKRVELEGGAKGIVTDSGIGQGWMDLIEFPNYKVTVGFSGPAVKLDPDNKIAEVTKSDGGTMTYEQAYEALARAVAHNAASSAQLPSGVSDVGKKEDPCTLLTLDDVKQTMPDFTVTGPESRPSAYGGTTCFFRATSDLLKTTVQIHVGYLTQAQFEQMNPGSTAKKSDLGGVTVFLNQPAGVALLNQGSRYVRLWIAVEVNDPDAMEKVGQMQAGWVPTLAQKIAARMGQ
jgi:hypothetical protein